MIDPTLKGFYERLYPEDDHPLRVSWLCATEQQQRVALCHDTLEDGKCEVLDLYKVGLSNAELADVIALTRRKATESYPAYIDRLVDEGSPDAIAVKIADLIDHIHPVRIRNLSVEKLEKYLAALDVLSHMLRSLT